MPESSNSKRKAAKGKPGAGKLNMSAGILVFRRTGTGPEVLLGHPGGPFWKNKDGGSWTIPKGEPHPGEELKNAAFREFREETGWELDQSEADPLTPVKQKAGKWIHAWAVEGYRAVAQLTSNTFEIEWPPHSGRKQSFPEIDRFAWFTPGEAEKKINPAQKSLMEEWKTKLARQ